MLHSLFYMFSLLFMLLIIIYNILLYYNIHPIVSYEQYKAKNIQHVPKMRKKYFKNNMKLFTDFVEINNYFYNNI